MSQEFYYQTLNAIALAELCFVCFAFLIIAIDDWKKGSESGAVLKK
jgi:hypothetical protein